MAKMAKTQFASVDDYIAAQPDPVRAILKTVRRAIRKGMPRAEEVISYQIPTYKLNGRAVLYFAGWKNHYSIYPAKEPLVAKFQKELTAFEITKGTIKFPLDQPVPVKLIEGIAKFRAKMEEEG
jgi:uncharacterized protein YdhG (YjbR/CyaY superfamily)